MAKDARLGAGMAATAAEVEAAGRAVSVKAETAEGPTKPRPGTATTVDAGRVGGTGAAAVCTGAAAIGADRATVVTGTTGAGA